MRQPSLFDFEDRTRRVRKRRRRRRLYTVIAITVSSLLVATAAVAFFSYRHANDSIVRSDFVLPPGDQLPAESDAQNILIMGMDSRLDQHGNPLPEEVYEALQAGGAEDGGYNANVLMLLHLPGNGEPAVGISIPRDNYVEIAGAPLGVTFSKIKEAYGLAMQEHLDELSWSTEEVSDEEAYQRARAAGRQAQIETVSRFLGEVPIDHFIEMSMGGFYHIAEAVAPITVCLNHATEDTYSGADFPAGIQELDAPQAMSFVRQRRDTGTDGPLLSDLDRTRRQQVFIVALADRLQEKSTLMNPKTIDALVGGTQSHVALDADFDILEFLQVAQQATQTGVRFATLPVEEFGLVDGSYVNFVDVDDVQAEVAQMLDGSYFAAPHTEEADDEAADETPAHGSVAPDEDPAEPHEGVTRYESWDEPGRAGTMPCVI